MTDGSSTGDASGGSSAQQSHTKGEIFNDEDQMISLEDVLSEYDADGDYHGISESEPAPPSFSMRTE
jgi:hypothetical protein